MLGGAFKGVLGVHLEDKQWSLASDVAARATVGLQLHEEKLPLLNEGGKGSIVSVPGGVTPGRLTQSMTRVRGSGDGCRRYK